ncbi:MAG: hypothetical protein ACXIU8_14930 [Alkalilacustris sp.]
MQARSAAAVLRGPVVGIGLSCLVWAGAAAGAELEVMDRDGGRLARLALPDDGRWCLIWVETATADPAADCYRTDADGVVLEQRDRHDRSIGRVETPAEAGGPRQTPEGGVWTEGIDRRIPADGVQAHPGGASSGHRLVSEHGGIDLGEVAGDGAVLIRRADGAKAVAPPKR